jgi:hypothetical protein
VPRVEARGRLVEEQHAGLSRQNAGEVDPLPFASREAPDVAILEARRVDLFQRGTGDVEVPAGGCGERAEEGGAAEEDDVERRRREERLEALRKVAEEARRGPAGDAPEGYAIEEDLATGGGEEAREDLEERRFPRAVLAQERDEASLAEGDRDAKQDVAAPNVAGGDALEGEGRQARLRRRTRNAGAPRSAVTAPIEISFGAKRVRASRSEATRRIPPPRKEPRRSAR